MIKPPSISAESHLFMETHLEYVRNLRKVIFPEKCPRKIGPLENDSRWVKWKFKCDVCDIPFKENDNIFLIGGMGAVPMHCACYKHEGETE